MVKSQLLFVIPVISAFLLLLQFIALHYLTRQNEVNSNQSWRTLYTVTNAASSNDIYLILIDPKTLSRLNQSQSFVDLSSYSYCQILCFNQKVTTLAMLAEFTSRGKIFKLKKDLEEKDFTVVISGKKDATYSRVVQYPDELFHLFVFDSRAEKDDCHVVHLVVFHNKLKKFWYRGALDLAEDDRRLLFRKGFRTTFLSIPPTSTLFPKIEIVPTIIDGLVINSPKDISIFLNPSNELEYIECNQTNSKKFHSRYPFSLDDIAEQKKFRVNVYNLLIKVIEILDGLEIPFWLSSGTLLGHYRQCDVIHYSNDVDIGIKITDYKSDLINLFSLNDIPLLHIFGRVNDSFELSFRDEFIKLDIFFFYEESDHVWNGGTSTSDGQKFKYFFNKFDLCWSNYLGLRVRIPCPTLPYIESNYGLNWFDPIKQWDWKSSPSNVRSNGHWPVNEWPQVMQSFIIQ